MRRISICSATHNQRPYLEDWYRGLEAQLESLQDDFELEVNLVIDEKDYETGRETWNSYFNCYQHLTKNGLPQSPLFKINYVINKTNEGGPASITKALEMATGQYIGILECDDYYKPFKLRETIDYLELEDLDGCHTEISARVYSKDYPHGRWVEKGWSNIGVHQEKVVSFERLLQSNCIYTCSWIMKSEWFKNCPTPLQIYNHLGILGDYAMALHMTKNGARIGYLNRPLSVYRDGVGVNTTKRQESIDSDYKVRQWGYQGCPKLD